MGETKGGAPPALGEGFVGLFNDVAYHGLAGGNAHVVPVPGLGGEKIDIIPWSENPLEFISRALSPARVIKVVQMGENTAIAVVPDDKLSLAIGRKGQNARLAVRLTGWKIDVKSESAALEELGGAENVAVDGGETAE